MTLERVECARADRLGFRAAGVGAQQPLDLARHLVERALDVVHAGFEARHTARRLADDERLLPDPAHDQTVPFEVRHLAAVDVQQDLRSLRKRGRVVRTERRRDARRDRDARRRHEQRAAKVGEEPRVAREERLAIVREHAIEADVDRALGERAIDAYRLARFRLERGAHLRRLDLECVGEVVETLDPAERESARGTPSRPRERRQRIHVEHAAREAREPETHREEFAARLFGEPERTAREEAPRQPLRPVAEQEELVRRDHDRVFAGSVGRQFRDRLIDDARLGARAAEAERQMLRHLHEERVPVAADVERDAMSLGDARRIRHRTEVRELGAIRVVELRFEFLESLLDLLDRAERDAFDRAALEKVSRRVAEFIDPGAPRTLVVLRIEEARHPQPAQRDGFALAVARQRVRAVGGIRRLEVQSQRLAAVPRDPARPPALHVVEPRVSTRRGRAGLEVVTRVEARMPRAPSCCPCRTKCESVLSCCRTTSGFAARYQPGSKSGCGRRPSVSPFCR